MSPKSLAFLIVGMVVISGVFVFFHVDYPSAPAQIVIKPPKGYVPPQIYQKETYNKNKLGSGNTSFKDYGNSTVIMQGYAINATNKSPIANATLYSAVLEAGTVVQTSQTGFYRIIFLQSGYGKFAFKIFQYNTVYTQNYLPVNETVWNNITFTPSPKYSVSGTTVYNGSTVSNVVLSFKSEWGAYTTSSSTNGQFSFNAVNGSYSINAQKKGFSNVTSPADLNIVASNVPSFTINLFSNNETGALIKGHSQNYLGVFLGDYSVYSNTSLQEASRNGFVYSVSADFGQNHLVASAPAYQNVSREVSVSNAVTYYNFSLPSINPFDPSPVQITETVSQANSTLFTSYLSDNASAPDYGTARVTDITGSVTGNGSSAKMANQKLEVLTSVNGTYFIEDIQTNSLGDYSFNMSFPGHYKFSIIDPLSAPFNFSGNLTGGNLNQNLNLSLKGGSIEKLNIHTKGEDNETLPGVNINITSGLNSNGTPIYSNTTSGNGNSSLNLTSGNYTVHLSKAGFNNVSYNLPPGSSNLNLSLTPVSSIGSNFTVWNSSSGLPGESPSNISSQLNSSKLPHASTINYNSTYFTLLMENGTVPLSNTEVAIFVYVNSYYYILKGTTNSSGELKVSLKFGGTYNILPESVDFNGTAISINTTVHDFTGSIVKDQMHGKKLFSLNLTLQNPYNYSEAAPPYSGLSVSGYLLPISPVTVIRSGNDTFVNYSAPSGQYNFTYSDQNFVPLKFYSTLNGNSVLRKTVEPYLVIITYDNSATLSVKVIGSEIHSLSVSGTGKQYLNETAGTVTVSSYLSGILTNSTTQTLSTSASVYMVTLSSVNLTYNISGSSSSLKYTESSNFAYYNFTFRGPGQNVFLYSIDYGSSGIDISSNFTLMDNSSVLDGILGPGSAKDSIVLSNYFKIVPGSENNFSLKYYNPGNPPLYGPDITLSYVTVSLSGVLE